MNSRRDRRGDGASSRTVGEINITPLMDLTFLLLIVFIITAPMLQYGLDVSPPQMTADKIDQSKSAVVTLTAHGVVLFQKEIVELGALQELLRSWRETHPDYTVLVAADAGRPYREVIEIMRTIRAAGVRSVSLLTQAEQSQPKRR